MEYTQNYLNLIAEQKKRIEDNNTDIDNLFTISDNATQQIYDELNELHEDLENVKMMLHSDNTDDNLVDEYVRRIEDNETNIKYLEMIVDKAVQQVYEESIDIEEDTEMAIETITKAGEKYLAMKSLHRNDWYQEL